MGWVEPAVTEAPKVAYARPRIRTKRLGEHIVVVPDRDWFRLIALAQPMRYSANDLVSLLVANYVREPYVLKMFLGEKE